MNLDFNLEQFDDILNYVRENVMEVVAGLFIVLLVVGYLIFTLTTIVPQWALRTQLDAQVTELETVLAGRTGAQQAAPAELQAQIAAAEVALSQAANVFLTEAQAAEILDELYQVAATNGVSIVDLQAQPAPTDPEKTVFDSRLFRLTAEGSMAGLTGFIGGIRATAVDTVLAQNINVAPADDGLFVLTMELAIYTSPFASGDALMLIPADAPGGAVPVPTPLPVVPSPTPTTAPPDPTTQLDALWAAGEWTAVITLLQQTLDANPNAADLREKLYAAHVNYGQQLAAAGQTDAARDQFERALMVQPNGGEALAALQALNPPPTSPPATTYVVQRGDTLYSIARNHGTTVDALRAANNLSGNNIHAGLQLVIPTP